MLERSADELKEAIRLFHHSIVAIQPWNELALSERSYSTPFSHVPSAIYQVKPETSGLSLFILRGKYRLLSKCIRLHLKVI